MRRGIVEDIERRVTEEYMIGRREEGGKNRKRDKRRGEGLNRNEGREREKGEGERERKCVEGRMQK